MKPDIRQYIKPGEIYTGSQVIELTGIPSSTFYHYVRRGKIPRREREIDGKPVYLGVEILHALTTTREPLPDGWFVKPRRGRPPKKT